MSLKKDHSVPNERGVYFKKMILVIFSTKITINSRWCKYYLQLITEKSSKIIYQGFKKQNVMTTGLN